MRWLACVVLIACHVDERFDTLHMKQPQISDPFKVPSWQLKNGLHVAVLDDPRARLTSVDLRFDVGTSDDPRALLAAEALGLRSGPAELTAAVAIDLDRIELTTTTLDLPGALELMAKRLETTCADLTPELVGAAREHARQQITGVPKSFLEAVWGAGQPYARDLGTPEVSASDLCVFIATHFSPSNATLVITGPVGKGLAVPIEARFGAIAMRKVPAQVAITPLTTSETPERHVVWGLAKPTAAFAYAIPALGDQNDQIVELALKHVQGWADERKLDLHVAIIGGRRGRALVLGVEADKEADLYKAREKLRDLLLLGFSVQASDEVESSTDEQLQEAQGLDDPFTRGSVIADLVASGRRIELLRRVRNFAAAKSPHAWIRENLSGPPSRVLDLIPASPGKGGGIEALADPASALDRSLANAVTVAATPYDAPPPPLAVAALDRPVEDYTLANGLRVLLAADYGATTVDVRLVFPIGIDDEPAPDFALHAAADLQIDDGFNAGPDARDRVTWYLGAVQHNDVEVTRASTHFRAYGFAALADWHLFSIGWHVISGTYDHKQYWPFHRHYVPKGGVLIVSGGFDRAVVKPIIERWYGSWPVSKTAPPPAMKQLEREPMVAESPEQQTVQLELAYRAATALDLGGATLLAAALQLRLAAATRGGASITVAFDPRDSRFLVNAEIDPSEAPAIAHEIAAEVAQLRSSGIAAGELDRARARALAHDLANEVGAVGRARQLEDAVIAKRAPNDDTLVAQMVAATSAQVSALAQQLLDPAALRVILRTPKHGAAAVLAALGIH